ncbi:MAG: class II glutamine amidotransferase [Candidatus Devosia symbiotica]|nr:class II glutamine amidotransferase [Candidatus Devosia symbiotica]
MINGDGCGVGWYGGRSEPGIYRGTLPAWSDANLASRCHQVSAPMFLAHVRSGTSGEVSMANYHSFTVGRHLFMHNGQISSYDRIRRSIDGMIPDTLYSRRRGNGDSEVIFLVALGNGLNTDPVAAMAQTLRQRLNAMQGAGVETTLRFAAILADSDSLLAFR